MAPEDRRTAILDAVIPELLEHGRDLSTRAMADAAGVAEGTLFRAFGDKEALLEAAAVRHWDPRPFRDQVARIDPGLPTAEKVAQLMELFIERFRGSIRLMTALRLQAPPRLDRKHLEDGWPQIMDGLFHPGELAVPAETVGYLIRLYAFGSAVPDFGHVRPFAISELTDLLLHGVLAPHESGN